MESLEISAKTVEEAIQKALDQLGVSRDEVNITVLKEGKPGILGLGGEPATIRVEPKTPQNKIDVAAAAREVLETLLKLMDVAGSVVLREKPSTEEKGAATPITFDIKGEDLGILIGRRGQTLTCLQYIVRLIVSHQTTTWVPIVVDVEEYKQRRDESLQALAWRMAEKVKTTRMPFTLEPMPAYERRIIHMALADHLDVTTQSIGEGEDRKVVIIPKNKR